MVTAALWARREAALKKCLIACTEYREADSAPRSNQLRPSAGWLRCGSFTAAAAQPNSQEYGRHHQGF